MMHTTAIGSESIDSAFVRELFRESFGPNTDKRGLPKGGSLDELFNSHELCMMGHPLVGIRTSAAADTQGFSISGARQSMRRIIS